MEASTATAPAPGKSLGSTIRSWLSRYGLILVLLLLPIRYGIQDLQNDGNLTHLATNVKDGISNGSIWALVALGYTLVYGIIELINFAHGDVFTIGTFVTIVVLNALGVQAGNPPKAFTWSLVGSLVLACLASFVVCAVLGVVIERIAYRPLRNAPRLAPLISAIGVSLILQDLGKLWKGNQFIAFPLGIHE